MFLLYHILVCAALCMSDNNNIGKASEKVNKKRSLGTQFYNFQPGIICIREVS